LGGYKKLSAGHTAKLVQILSLSRAQLESRFTGNVVGRITSLQEAGIELQTLLFVRMTAGFRARAAVVRAPILTAAPILPKPTRTRPGLYPMMDERNTIIGVAVRRTPAVYLEAVKARNGRDSNSKRIAASWERARIVWTRLNFDSTRDAHTMTFPRQKAPPATRGDQGTGTLRREMLRATIFFRQIAT
jgi:hypothetical protein